MRLARAAATRGQRQHRSLSAAALLAALLLAVTLLAFSSARPPTAPAQASDCPVNEDETITLGFDGEKVQKVGVPEGVQRVRVQARGGHGGQTSDTGKGGQGGLVTGAIPVSPGDCLEVYVGAFGDVPSEGDINNRGGYGWGAPGGDNMGFGHGGRGGGAASTIANNVTVLIVAGGGGGGGGNGQAGAKGGDGGNGAGGAGPGTPDGGDGGNGQGVPVSVDLDLGGIGGGQSGPDAGSGADQPVDMFAGSGGGGGSGCHGGGGGGAWYGMADKNLFKPVGGGGGGGGDSYADPSVEDVVFAVANVDCPTSGQPPECYGDVVLSWVLQPAKVAPYMGGGQSAPITAKFPQPLRAKVTAANGDPVAGTEVEFTLPSSGPSGGFGDSDATTATATTDENGIATSPPITANDLGGHWTATATVEGVSQPALFPLFNSPAPTTTDLLITSPTPVSGQQVRLVASVTAAPSSAGIPQGVVEFEVDGEAVGGPVELDAFGVAEPDPVTLKAGMHQVAAKFEGSTEFASSTDQFSTPVQRARTTVALSSSQNPAPAEAGVQFTAQVAAAAPGSATPTGQVRFLVDGEEKERVQVDPDGIAEAELELGAGLHLITAAYDGGSELRAGTGAMVQSMGDAVTATEVTSSEPASTYGEPLKFTALINGMGPLTGAVTFSAQPDSGGDAQVLCEDVEVSDAPPDFLAECEPGEQLEPGDYTITAEYSPDQVGVSASHGQTTQHVARAPVTAATIASPNPLDFGLPYELHTDVTAPAADPGGSVRFELDRSPVGDPVALGEFGATLTGDELPVLDAGPHAVTSTYEGSARFEPATSTTGIVVDPAPTATTVTSIDQGAPARAPVAFIAEVERADEGAGEVEGEVQFWIDGKAFGDPVPLKGGVATSQPAMHLEQGKHDVVALFTSSGNFAASEGSFLQRTTHHRPTTRRLPCPPARVLLADVHRFRGLTWFNGVADRRLAGRRVQLKRGSRLLGWTQVEFDGTFWGEVKKAGGRGAYTAQVGRFKSRLRSASALRVAARRPLGASRRGKARVVLEVNVRARRLVVGRQQGCGRGASEELRRVREPKRGGRVTITLRRPKAGRPFGVYRVWTPNRRHYSPPIVIRARGSARSG